MTIHSAKGLEFPVVFIVGMENGLFPSVTDMDKEDQMEEARRLCYVAITRAKESLYMTSAEMRRVFGRTVSYSQSDFLGEIKPDLKEYISNRGSSSSVLPNARFTQNPHGLRGSMYESRISSNSINTKSSGNTINSGDLTIGKKVKHPKFGLGTIVTISSAGDDKKLTIAFDKQGVKILLLSLANLEIL